MKMVCALQDIPNDIPNRKILAGGNLFSCYCRHLSQGFSDNVKSRAPRVLWELSGGEADLNKENWLYRAPSDCDYLRIAVDLAY